MVVIAAIAVVVIAVAVIAVAVIAVVVEFDIVQSWQKVELWLHGHEDVRVGRGGGLVGTKRHVYLRMQATDFGHAFAEGMWRTVLDAAPCHLAVCPV